MLRCVLSWLIVLSLHISLVAQEKTEPQPRLEKAVVFGKGGEVNLELNIAQPAQGKGPFPAVILIHGGGWMKGSYKDTLMTMIMLRPSCFGEYSTKPMSSMSSANFCSSRKPSSGRCCSRPRNMIVILTLSPALRNRTT